MDRHSGNDEMTVYLHEIRVKQEDLEKRILNKENLEKQRENELEKMAAAKVD